MEDHYKIFTMNALRDKKGGLVGGTIFAIGGLIIGVIVVLLIVSTIGDANLIADDSSISNTMTNETATAWSNNSVATLSSYSTNYLYWVSWNATRVMNGTANTGSNETLVEGTDYVIFSANGSIANKTQWDDGGKVQVTGSWVKTETYSKDAVTGLRNNLSDGLDNVSEKIPTILLIVAVILLFGVLYLLVRNTNLMSIFGGSGSGSI